MLAKQSLQMAVMLLLLHPLSCVGKFKQSFRYAKDKASGTLILPQVSEQKKQPPKPEGNLEDVIEI